MDVLISVVIPTFNRVKLLKECLAALEKQTLTIEKFEVIVISDGSTDGTNEFLEKLSETTHISFRYLVQTNAGPATARNLGIKEAKGELIAFTDDDCVPDPHWLADYLEIVPGDELCAGIGGGVQNIDSRPSKAFFDSIRSNRHPLPDSDGNVIYLITANACYKRHCLLDIGGFDTQIPGMVGGEDPDLSQRLIERGYYLKVSDKAIILHHDRVSVRRIYKTLKSYGYGNRMRADMGNIPFEDWSFIIGVQVFMRQSLIYRQRRDIKLSQKVYWFFLHLAYLVGYTSGYKKSIDANASQSPVIQSNNSSGLMPMVSVVIPCFNDGQYLIEAIESVESFPDLRIYEIILVDDGSTNSQTLTVYEQVEKKGHQVLRPGKIGKCQARNLGIRQAKAKYILALDADNKIKWTYLRKAIYAMEKDSRLGVVYGNAEFFGDKTGYNKTRAFDIRRMFFSNYIDTCAVFRKKVWEDVGGFDEEMPLQHREDWDFWLGAFSKGWQFCYLDEPMFYYRVRENAQGKIGDKEENRKVIESYVTAKYADMFREEFREMYMELDLIKNSKWILLRRVIIFPFEILRHFFGKKN